MGTTLPCDLQRIVEEEEEGEGVEEEEEEEEDGEGGEEEEDGEGGEGGEVGEGEEEEGEGGGGEVSHMRTKYYLTFLSSPSLHRWSSSIKEWSHTVIPREQDYL